MLAIAVLQGMAAGTLLYVTFYEVTKTIITFENIVITKIITDTSLLVQLRITCKSYFRFWPQTS